MMVPAILCVNSGSSSLKAALFEEDGSRADFRYGDVGPSAEEQHRAFGRLLAEVGDTRIDAVAHRIVHGGDAHEPVRRVDSAERARLDALVKFAPLHMPNNLAGIDLISERTGLPQYACFDTAFHRTQPRACRVIPVPADHEMEKYGFHGISYAYIAENLPTWIAGAAEMRILVAHLGSGASLCMLERLASRETTMGLTPLGGVVMATRPGDLDPGIVLALASTMDREGLTRALYHSSGLAALSGGAGGDLSQLETAEQGDARFAFEYFCASVKGAIGQLAARAGGLDALVFTGGIGHHSWRAREAICDGLAFLGMRLDNEANRSGQRWISRTDSMPVLQVATDEEWMMYRWTMAVHVTRHVPPH